MNSLYIIWITLLLLIPSVYPFVILPSKVILSTRLDPVVQPGQVSSHVHNIVGGNKFNAHYSPDELLSSTCTSTPITIDKSNYWAPSMYYINQTRNPETYVRVPSGFNIYYLPRAGADGVVKAFPRGLKMVAGNAMKNTYNASLFEDQAISYVCLNYADENINGKETPGFPTDSCPDGIRAQVFFPSCWNNQDTDSSDHKEHMSYPVQQYNTGDCPSSHPVKLISLFYEQIFSTGGFPLNPDGRNWILSNGDTTGHSFHADFQDGWEDLSLLQRVADECASDESNGQISECAPLVPLHDPDAAAACQIDPNVQIPAEDVGFYNGWILGDTLLGDNPVWEEDEPTKPSSSTTPNSTEITWGRVGSLQEGVGTLGGPGLDMSSVVTEGYGVSNVSLTGESWQVRGCFAEGTRGRALEGIRVDNQTSLMSLRRCAVICELGGWDVAGLEYGGECYCDHVLRNGATIDPLPDKMCGRACQGNIYENCGGESTLTILAKEGVTLRSIGPPSSAVSSSPSLLIAMFLFLITFLSA